MADNVTIPVTSDTVAADDISGVKYQRIKIVIGSDGVNGGDVSAGNALPVSIASLPLPTDAATQTTLAALNTKVTSCDTGAVVGTVGGYAVNPTATFNRPSDTTAYAIGDLVANSVTAGSVTPLSFTVARVAAGSFMIRRLKLSQSNVGNNGYRVHLYSASPTTANGDNGAYSSNGVETYLGAYDVTTDNAFTDGSAGFGVPVTGNDIIVKLASGSSIYGLIEARTAFTPSSGATYTVTLETLQN